MELNVSADINQLLRSLDTLQSNKIPQAAARALNKTLTTVAAEAARQVKSNMSFNLKINEIKSQLRKWYANSKSLTAKVYATGKRLPIIRIDPHAAQTASGVVYRSGNQTKIIPRAFLATVKSGHKGVFTRRGKARLPISEKYGPSIPKVFLNPFILAALGKVAENRWNHLFSQELRYALRK